MPVEMPILVENEKKRLNIRLPLLICFAMFNAWKMGMVYFSGQALSVDGMTPLPVDVENLAILLAAGFILSILVMFFILRATVWMERITCAVALVSMLLLFLPFPPVVLAQALYVNFFCCYFMYGFEIAIIVGLFTKKTAAVHMTVAYGISALLVAALHNGFIDLSFEYFRLFVIVSCALQLLFYFKIPGSSFPRYLKKTDNLVMPKRFFAFMLVWVAMACSVILFGTAVAETVKHGVAVLYLTAAVSGLVIFLLWRRFGISPLSACSVFTAMGALGFVTAICSLFFPALALASCAFFGMAWICCWMGPLIAGVLYAKLYPSRFVFTAIIGTIMGMILIHTMLLDSMRGNMIVLYIVYSVIAVIMVGLFLVLKPFLDYSFRGTPLISDERSAELIEKAKAKAKNNRTLGSEQSNLRFGAESKYEITENQEQIADDELTEREQQIAQELMSGLDYKEIAEKLYISPHTVNSHKKSIYSKKGVHNVQGLILKIGKLNTD
jgi:DNA-binding CsgD family transcriptional regulator